MIIALLVHHFGNPSSMTIAASRSAVPVQKPRDVSNQRSPRRPPRHRCSNSSRARAQTTPATDEVVPAEALGLPGKRLSPVVCTSGSSDLGSCGQPEGSNSCRCSVSSCS
ncbi:MAG: hypothetical protein KQH59_20370 [Desulfobulbaceae bacterium]|nr:hypothetical protein [Desulfobulbaceae bacterium]